MRSMEAGTREDYYTVLGVRDDGAIPVVELLACDADETALQRAAAWLATHASCSRAQVWRDTVLVGEIGQTRAHTHRSPQFG